jgi:hypothetical protein
MSNTVEVAHNYNINRLLILKKTLNELGYIKYPISGTIKKDVFILYDKYMAGVSSHIIKYYETSGNRDGFWAFIKNINVVGALESYTRKIRSIVMSIDTEKINTTRLLQLLDSECTYKLPTNKKLETSFVCKCNKEIVISSDELEYICGNCGIMTMVFGSQTCDVNSSPQYLNKPKYPRHHPNKHCKLWIGRIQAWNGPDIDNDVFKTIICLIKRDNINIKKIKCEQMRRYLKECKLTKYNNFIPYLRKIITGVSPPQLRSEELGGLYFLFNKISLVLKNTCPERNISYYPFFIYKILDFILPNGIRKSRILECIHLQSVNTINIVDNLYQKACNEIEEITYRPTNKREHIILL